MDKDIFKNKKVREIVAEIAEIAGYLWQRGWAEKNAGNISVNITGLFSDREFHLSDHAGTMQGEKFRQISKELAGQGYLVTCAGTRMRDISENPDEYLCLIKAENPGKIRFYANRKNKDDRKEPTSELLTHLSIHRMLLSDHPEFKVIIHTHATELIALTQIKQFKSEKTINQLLGSMHPEIMTYIPEGVGFIPFTLPGTPKIASASVNSLKNHPVVIWEKHGVFATGKSLAEAFDLVDIVVKSASIFFMCRQAGFEPEGLTAGQLKKIKKYYKI